MARRRAVDAGHYMRKDIDVVRQVADGLGIDLGVLGEAVDGGPADFRLMSGLRGGTAVVTGAGSGLGGHGRRLRRRRHGPSWP
jgi:hypothetical protein